MTLKDRAEIHRPPEQVWRVIENPETMKLWNPNVKDVVLHNWGARAQGFRYRITYALSGQPGELDAETLEYHSPTRLVIKLTGGRFSRNDYVYEIYELVPVEGGTRLEQTIEIHDSGIPLIFRIVSWFIRRFGKPTGKSYLVGVKELAEGVAARRHDPPPREYSADHPPAPPRSGGARGRHGSPRKPRIRPTVSEARWARACRHADARVGWITMLMMWIVAVRLTAFRESSRPHQMLYRTFPASPKHRLT